MTTWDCFARFNHSGTGVLALFRNQADLKTVKVQFSLLPAGEFKLRSVIANKNLGLFSRSDWVRGVPVTFSATTLVEILEVTTARQRNPTIR